MAAPGPKISRYERPRAVRRSRSGALHGRTALGSPDGPAPPLPDRSSARRDEPVRTAHGSYRPRRDGEPDPGEVVWAWVPFEDDPQQGKDRPVLVLGSTRSIAGWG